MLIPPTMRPSVYQVLVSLMDGALSDLVTRFTSAESLKDCTIPIPIPGALSDLVTRFTSAESLKDCTIPIPIPIAIALVATTNSKL